MNSTRDFAEQTSGGRSRGRTRGENNSVGPRFCVYSLCLPEITVLFRADATVVVFSEIARIPFNSASSGRSSEEQDSSKSKKKCAIAIKAMSAGLGCLLIVMRMFAHHLFGD